MSRGEGEVLRGAEIGDQITGGVPESKAQLYFGGKKVSFRYVEPEIWLPETSAGL